MRANRKLWSIVYLRLTLVIFLTVIIADAFSGELHNAIHDRDVPKIRALLEKGLDVNEQESVWGLSPLGSAACEGQQDIAEWLIARGADLNARDHVGRIALHCAIMYGHRDFAMWLIGKGSEVNVKGYEGDTPLHLAVQYTENAKLNRMLLDKGANVNERNDHKQTSLHKAIQPGNAAIAQLLIDYGADVNALDGLGHSPLSYAFLYDQPDKEIIDLLLRHGANPNSVMRGVCTPIHEAAKNGHREIVVLLISYHADIHCKCNGIPLLHSAAGDQSLLEVLYAKGLDISEKDEFGRIILHAAAEQGLTVNTLEWLMERGLDINVKDSSGMTPLHIAAQQGNILSAKLLIAKGADVNIQDLGGMTPLHYAINEEHPNTADLLVNAGADARIKDNEGSSALDIAPQELKIMIDNN